jgi:hypothetical protein
VKGHHCNGKTCANCTFHVCREEAREAGLPEGKSPSLEDCQKAIVEQKAKRTTDRMESHARSVRDMNAAQKADKAACIFYFNHADAKRTRRANMLKELFGERLLAICENKKLHFSYSLTSRPT